MCYTPSVTDCVAEHNSTNVLFGSWRLSLTLTCGMMVEYVEFAPTGEVSLVGVRLCRNGAFFFGRCDVNDDRFSFRWGVPWLDMGFLQVPNCFFKRYAELGISKDEYLFVLHLAVYKYESPRGVAQPSLGTIARQMGISKRQVQRLRASLEDGGWLTVRLRPGETSLYDFQAFALAMMRLEEVALRRRLPNPGPGCYTHITSRGDTCVMGTHDTHVMGGVTPTSWGGDTGVTLRTNNKEKKQQQQEPGGVVSSPTAREGSGPDRSSAGRRKVAGNMPAREGGGADQGPGGHQGSTDHVLVWELNGGLQDVGIGQEQGIELIEKYGAERIQEVLTAVRSQGDKIRDPAAWIVTALRRKFQVTTMCVGDDQADVQHKKRVTCAWFRNPGLGSCPSVDVGQALFSWCEGCEKMAGD